MDTETVVVLPELGGELLALVVWFLVGAGLVPVVVANLSLSTALYAALSLSLVRIVPVALALIGTGLSRRDVLFLGWFGPRGLASVVFALLAVEALTEAEHPLVGHAVSVVALTVLLSVVLHGVTAAPAARRFGSAPDRGAQAAPAARPQWLTSPADSAPGAQEGGRGADPGLPDREDAGT